ncbi:MAG: M15 family metallopeptidase [Phaeodactylibacter sp.]|nr:M15 family metallopeptidase [Phaeodactylibacter sp.]
MQARNSTLRADIRYATTNNFVKQVLYPCGRCYLRPAVAEALLRVHRQLQQQGKGLKVYDCYRPLAIQWKMWEIVPDPRYVSDPSKGSMHNRGAAVDLTIVDDQGKELDMGTDFEFFGKEAWPEYDQHPAEVIANRQLLRSLMEAEGFKGIRTEWWHFSYSRQSYPISEAVWPCQ